MLRANASASSAAITIRSTLNSINPSLSAKLPDSVLNVTANLSQNRLVDTAARAAPWITALYLPVGLLGLALLIYVLTNAEQPIPAVRFIGLTMAVAGALPIGLGAAAPVFGLVGRNTDPGRGAAVGSFVDVLLGRLVTAGWVVLALGLLFAFTPGRAGASLRVRVARAVTRVREWMTRRAGNRIVAVSPCWCWRRRC